MYDFIHSTLTHPLPVTSITADKVEQTVHALLAQAEQELQQLENVSHINYQSIFKGLDRLGNRLDDYMVLCSQVESLVDNKALTQAYQKVQPQVSAFYARVPFSEKLYQHVQAVYHSKDFAELSSDQQRYVQQTLDTFRRHGAELSADKKQQLEKIEVQLSEKTLKFAQNVLDATDAFDYLITDESQLAGLPRSAINTAKASAEKKEADGWRFTLQGPSYVAIMTYLDDRHIREVFYKAYNTRASDNTRNNQGLIQEVIALRQEKANILGYQDVSDLYLADRMVKTGKAASEFVLKLTERTQYFATEEHQALIDFAHTTLHWQGPIEAWDLAYIAEKMRKDICDFDQEVLRPYFEVNTVLRGMFDIVAQIFSVTVTTIEDIPTWHTDVKTYQVHNQQGQLQGIFYADLFAREGKQGGAWMCPLLYGTPVSEQEQPHVGLICGNFTPPINGESLITHREVETLFHEFGHLLHHLLGRSEIRAHAGTNVAWDFVELPSQIMENWCWEKEALQIFAKHVKTQESIPDELFERLKAVRTFRAATGQMRQLCFAHLDLQLHREYAVKPSQPVLKYAYDLMQSFSPTPLPQEYSMVTGFTHLFASPVGYAAAYYSYKWAEVLDADAFTRFQQEGLFSKKVGTDFVDHILSQGDSRDPLVLYRSFMNREPNMESLFKRSGIGQSA